MAPDCDPAVRRFIPFSAPASVGNTRAKPSGWSRTRNSGANLPALAQLTGCLVAGSFILPPGFASGIFLFAAHSDAVPRVAPAQQSNFSVWFQKARGDYCSDVWSCRGPGLAFIEEYAYRRNWPNVSVEEWFVVFSGLALLACSYFIPSFTMCTDPVCSFCRHCCGKNGAPLAPLVQGIIGYDVPVMLSISSCWTRGNLARAEAKWQAAELIHSSGVAARDVGGNQTWSCYYGAFDEWIAEIGG